MLNRSVVQRTTPNAARRQLGGVTAWSTEARDTMTLCVTALDPDAFPTEHGLRSLVAGVLARRGLAPAFW